MLLVLAWMAAALAACEPSTPSDGCRADLLPGDLVITEVFADYKAAAGTTGVDTGKEWFEIYNARGQPIDLAGLTITSSRPDGSRPNRHAMRAAVIAAGQYFTLGSAPPGMVPAYVDYGYGSDLGELSNTGGGKLALSCGGQEIDSASYGDITEGHARELTGAQRPDYTINDDPASWCQANDAEFETGNFGTPGAASDCRPIASGQCSDGGAMRRAVAPGPGDLVITEVMPSPTRVADSAGEWLEVRVMTDVDLNGVGVGRIGGTPDAITAASCVHVRAGSYVVFARSADPAQNGGIPAAAIAGTFHFNLIGGAPASPGDVAIVAGATVVDAVTWTRSTAGAALQLDPARIDPSANDSESNFCDATQPYGPAGPAPDRGTPGTANAPCPLLPAPGMCDDGTRVRAIVRPVVGQLVISEILANPANVAGATDATREWFEVANTGDAFDLNELVVGRIGAAGAPVASARCLTVAPHGFAVFARSADPGLDGMLPHVDATFRFGLVDTSGDIEIASGATVLDAVRWTSVTPGVASQLDPRHLTPADNDDDASFCPATAAYGDQTNLGTPGAANRPCP
ncbi:MAG: lamin tail domain-containing protein [Deltaproteobacteria bacterium]|nr:MAG: lamin tail domain-containing protein [Deltaproteobacteria bacterium]